jgi:hypothetical protein
MKTAANKFLKETIILLEKLNPELTNNIKPYLNLDLD